MFYTNKTMLADLGFKQVIGFSKYMIKGDNVYSITKLKLMTIRKDGRINLTKDDGSRTCVAIRILKPIKDKK